MSNELANLISQIRIDTEYGPPIILDQPFSPSATASGASPLAWLKPRITITPSLRGIGPITSAPWGDPGPTKWPQVQLGLVVAGALGLSLLGYGIYRALK